MNSQSFKLCNNITLYMVMLYCECFSSAGVGPSPSCHKARDGVDPAQVASQSNTQRVITIITYDQFLKANNPNIHDLGQSFMHAFGQRFGFYLGRFSGR